MSEPVQHLLYMVEPVQYLLYMHSVYLPVRLLITRVESTQYVLFNKSSLTKSQCMLSLLEGLLKITLTVPFISYYYHASNTCSLTCLIFTLLLDKFLKVMKGFYFTKHLHIIKTCTFYKTYTYFIDMYIL